MEKIITNTKNNKVDPTLFKFIGNELFLTIKDIKSICGYRDDYRNSIILERIDKRYLKLLHQPIKNGELRSQEVVSLDGLKMFVSTLTHESKKQNGEQAIRMAESYLQEIQSLNSIIVINEEEETKIESKPIENNLTDDEMVERIGDLCKINGQYVKGQWGVLYKAFNKKYNVNLYGEHIGFENDTTIKISKILYIKHHTNYLKDLYHLAVELYS